MTTLIPKFDFKNGNSTPAGAVNRAINLKLAEAISVTDFGADSTGVTDSYAAFAAAWAFIKTTGGSILIPQGTYLLNTAWTCDVDLTAGHNYLISGYGATIKTGASVTSWAVNVTGGYNNFGVTIQGLQFDQIGNANVNGAIRGVGTANLKLIDCVVELDDNKATYAAFQLQNTTPGDGSGCFWTLIDSCTTRQRSGNLATYGDIGVNLISQCNATKIVNCSFTSVIDAIRFSRDPVNGDTVNGVRIFNNDFEGVTNCLTIDTSSPATYAPTGCFISFSRVESVTTFINWTGALVTEGSQPLLSQANYLTTGAVTNYVVNPNNQRMYIQESSFYATPTVNYIGSASDFSILTGNTGSNFHIVNTDGGGGTYDRAHLVFGDTYQPYHLWVDSSGRLRIKGGSAPTSATDGTIVGTQS